MTFGENIDYNLASDYQALLLTQNMTAIFGSDPLFQVRFDKQGAGPDWSSAKQ